MEKRKNRTMEVKRKKFQGVLNVLSFNRHFYIYGLTVLVFITASQIVIEWPIYLLWIIIGMFLYGLLMPLIVSAYVYDYSGYYNFHWINDFKKTDSKTLQILNINAGFDETSFGIQNNFPEANLKVFDFYDAQKHTEPAIIRARKVTSIFPNTRQIKSNTIPLEDNSIDIIFLLSALHEIRTQEEKIRFLKECNRICKPDGNIVLVEHLRDIPNFLAFSIGFTHFFSKKTWKKAFKEAGFSLFSETKFTPFMSIFNFHT
jgi:ubiquinone/menaquinone biosynthesis C-methylase UbiE